MLSAGRLYGLSKTVSHYRVLVDRLWPRGIKKTEVPWDEWMKEIAPSPELRTWFGHKSERWTGFRQRYLVELDQKHPEVQRIRDLERLHGHVELLTAAKDPVYNHAKVILEFLENIREENNPD